ncbi:brain-specific angiogenesis inhibitor 1-associated protein 2-like protein 1a isoform X1 [Electrophorus electricus]|uniref:BAR/IMD domain-containing adapter protein 2-like 1 n=1 Tax=Electrophorus electricus TaxID=8005 RepID=A0A4W4F553_ELEEL|nr:brain-specific angiogenesis inhibitor 1-associated protein 2-like protein 1a isoform X1 [Electrophorus electricus]
MSRDADDVNKLTESTYKNVMENFNPNLRNLVNLGKSYEKSVTAMTLAGKAYYDAVSKIGENAAVSPVSREMGVILMEISEMHKKVHEELVESFKRFHREIMAELEKKTDLDIKYMTATFKRYQSEHKMRQDSLDKSQTDLKKLRRKSQGKHSNKYEVKENEFLVAISSRQTEMQKFMEDSCKEALLEEKRRFCFLVDKHCTFSYQMATFHDKAKEMLSMKLPSWQEKCSDATKVPDTVTAMIKGLRDHASSVDEFSSESPDGKGSDAVVPPAPPLKAHTSPLANMFSQESFKSPVSPEACSDQESLDSNSLSSETSAMKKPRVLTIFPHTAGNNDTLLSFDDGDVITLLIQEERDGWLYGELEKTGERGWFPSSYCRTYSDPVMSNVADPPLQNFSIVQHPDDEEEEEQPVLMPPPDYSDSCRKTPTPSAQNTGSLPNGTSMAPFLGGGNPFATVRLRPTVTNDRSAPVI